MPKVLAWFSCGATSAVACKLALDRFGKDVELLYIETGASHPDNKRFIADCERWYGRKILILKNKKYSSPCDVAIKRGIFNTPYGAPCTLHLKKEVRQTIEGFCKDAVHVLGFEYTKKEVNRALRWKEQQGKKCYFPLIEAGYDKRECLLELQRNKIEVPAMYKLGYNNNNCIGCFKGGQGYWNKVRKDFPEIFNKVADLEQQLNATCLKSNGEKLFLKDLPKDAGRHTDIEIPDCALFCDVEMQGLKIKEIEECLPKLIYKEEK